MKQRSQPKIVGGDYEIVPGSDAGDVSRLSGALLREEDDRGNNTYGHDDGLSLSRDDEVVRSHTELRLNVFREVLFAGRPPRSPRYYEARPKHFPPELNVVLTGGLYTSIHKAVVEFVPSYNEVYSGAMLIGCIVAFASDLFHVMEGGKRRFNYAGYQTCAVGVYVASTAASCYITRPIVGRFHYRMEAVVREMSPLFRRAGYDLEYHRREPVLESASSWWARLCGFCLRESFVRIVPFRGELTQEEAAKAAALFDPQRRSAGDPTAATAESVSGQSVGGFRVAVYGAQAYPGQVGFGREPNFVMARSFQQFSDRIDEYSWGAVATEMRNYTDRYRQARTWPFAVALTVWSLPALMSDAFSSWYVVAPYLVLVAFLYVVLFYPTKLETWWLKRVGGIPELDELRATIQRLSPLVEERSGYALRLDMEPEGYLGGTCAFVCFVPRDVSQSVPVSSTV
jgi:hypothetical protein